MRDTLHWLPIRQRIFYRVAVLVWHCLLGIAPGTVSSCIDPGWASSASFLFWWKTISCPCKHLDYVASCILSCCTFYQELKIADSIATKELHTFATKELHTFALQAA